VEAYPSREIPAVVKRIDPMATIISGVVNYPVMAVIQKDGRLLKPDMTANITIKTAERRALVVPNSAIQRDGEQRYVFLLQGGKQEKRAVTIGTRDAGFTEIKKGLSATNQVIINRAVDSGKRGEKP
jgi:multidrug efflux pump subunit AcrA (membrane-fusion protein)